MSPVGLSNLYERLRQRLSVHAPDSCRHISVLLPHDFSDELGFYRLVFWGYALFHEAAKVPLQFLTKLPPRLSDDLVFRELSRLRTYVSHNLNHSRKRDQSTYMFVHSWFGRACGHGSPDGPDEYGMCCDFLAERLRCALSGAIAACDLLDDPTDGARLVSDLRSRVDLRWEAHRFDSIVQECAVRLGNPGLDLKRFRNRHLDKWRRTLVESQASQRVHALELRIEEDLLGAIGEALPLSSKEAWVQLGVAGVDAVVAALLLLRNSRRFGRLALPELIQRVASSAMDSVNDDNLDVE